MCVCVLRVVYLVAHALAAKCSICVCTCDARPDGEIRLALRLEVLVGTKNAVRRRRGLVVRLVIVFFIAVYLWDIRVCGTGGGIFRPSILSKKNGKSLTTTDFPVAISLLPRATGAGIAGELTHT